MSTALKRGRNLDHTATALARRWRRKRIRQLLSRDRISLTPKERHEAVRLTKRWDFWNYELPAIPA